MRMHIRRIARRWLTFVGSIKSGFQSTELETTRLDLRVHTTWTLLGRLKMRAIIFIILFWFITSMLLFIFHDNVLRCSYQVQLDSSSQMKVCKKKKNYEFSPLCRRLYFHRVITDCELELRCPLVDSLESLPNTSHYSNRTLFFSSFRFPINFSREAQLLGLLKSRALAECRLIGSMHEYVPTLS